MLQPLTIHIIRCNVKSAMAPCIQAQRPMHTGVVITVTVRRRAGLKSRHLREGDDDRCSRHEAGDDRVRQEVCQPAQFQDSHNRVQAAGQERHLQGGRYLC